MVAFSPKPNSSLQSLQMGRTGLEGYTQQIADEMQALFNQGVPRIDRAKEMLTLGENVHEASLEYTWATWEYVIQEEVMA